MKFKITEVDTLKLKVEYDDGSWAIKPTLKNAEKSYYASQIKTFCTTPQEPVPINEIPYKIGDEGTVGDDVATGDATTSQTYDYGTCRDICYPPSGLQFEALWAGRKGDDTKQIAIDAHIQMVKDKFPVDQSVVYTVEDLEKALTELKADSRWVKDNLD